MKSKVFQVEFRRRLERLYDSLGKSLDLDRPYGNFWPNLYSVFTFLWCNAGLDDLTTK